MMQQQMISSLPAPLHIQHQLTKIVLTYMWLTLLICWGPIANPKIWAWLEFWPRSLSLPLPPPTPTPHIQSTNYSFQDHLSCNHVS